jgi:hypothetical protein
VVLVDQSDRFVFKPMLYELLSGGTAVSSLKTLLLVYLFWKNLLQDTVILCRLAKHTARLCLCQNTPRHPKELSVFGTAVCYGKYITKL